MRILLLLFLLFGQFGCSTSNSKYNYIPRNGVVPDEATARLIAEAVLVPIYGKAEISSQKPFDVKLKVDRWIVRGSTANRPPDSMGGFALIEISKNSGEILRISNGE